MTDQDYIFYQQIQDYKAQYFMEHREGLSFRDAVNHLLSAGAALRGNPPRPDFLSWDLQSMAAFRKLIGQIPVYLKEMEQSLRGIIPLVDNARHLFPRGDAQILLESCYTAPELAFTDFFTVIYVLDGGCVLHLKEDSHKLETGGLCILSPGTPYYVYSGPDDLVINIQSKASCFLSNFSQLLRHETVLTSFFRHTLLEDFRDCRFFFLPPDKRIRLLIQSLFTEYMTDDPYSGTAFNNFLQTFYLAVIRSTEPTYTYYASRENTPSRVLMPAVLEYITQNYHTLTLQTLAAHFHYDSTYMSHLVRQLTGRSFRSILTELKLNEARQLLRDTTYTIGSIAQRAGFKNPEAFTYSMKKADNCTPTEYRSRFPSAGQPS